MRTKTLLLTAALGAAGIAGAMAQTVYSVNAVGFVNLTLPVDFSLIANPLNGTNNNLSTILPVVPDGTQLLKWDTGTQAFADANVYYEGVGWFPDNTLAPGEGAFVNLLQPFTMTFVGEVPQGDTLSATVAGPNKFSILSQLTPQAIGLSAAGFPAADGDQVLFWNNASSASGGQAYKDAIVYYEGVGWYPGDPTPAIGEAFFYNNTGSQRTWTRSFHVN